MKKLAFTAIWLFVLFLFGAAGSIIALGTRSAEASKAFPFVPWLHASYATVGSAQGPRSAAPTVDDAGSVTRYTTGGVVTSSVSEPTITSALSGCCNTQTLTTNKATGLRVSEDFDNYVTSNENLSEDDPLEATDWTSSGTPTVTNGQTDPAGTTKGDRIEDNDGAADEFLYQDMVVDAAGTGTDTYHVTWWAKCPDALHDFRVTVSGQGGGAESTTATYTCSLTWKRYNTSLAFTGGGSTNLRVELHPIDTAAGTGSADFWRPVVTKGEPDWYHADPTTTNTASLSESSVSYTGVPVGDTGTVCGWFYTGDYSATNTVLLWDGAADDLKLEFSSTSQPQFTVDVDETTGDADASVIKSGELGNHEWDHVCWAWSQGAVAIYKDGAEGVYSGTPDQSWVASQDFGSTLKVQSSNGEVIISQLKYWRRKLIAARIVTEANRFSTLYAKAPIKTARDQVLASMPDAFRRLWARAIPEASAGEPDAVLVE